MTRSGDPPGGSAGDRGSAVRSAGGVRDRGLRSFLVDDRRGQLVLVAAGVVAVAFVALVAAYLQLGYHADVRAGEPDPDPGRNAERVLSRAVHEAALANQGSDRDAVIEGTKANLSDRIDTLEAARVEQGTVYRVEYNDTAADGFAAARCPGGPARQFGPCTATDGVVTQERAGEYHVVAVAFDVTVTTDSGDVELTFVIRAVGGSVRGE